MHDKNHCAKSQPKVEVIPIRSGMDREMADDILPELGFSACEWLKGQTRSEVVNARCCLGPMVETLRFEIRAVLGIFLMILLVYDSCILERHLRFGVCQ